MTMAPTMDVERVFTLANTKYAFVLVGFLGLVVLVVDYGRMLYLRSKMVRVAYNMRTTNIDM